MNDDAPPSPDLLSTRTRARALASAAPLVALVVLAAGCGSSGSDSATTTSTAATSTASDAAPATDLSSGFELTTWGERVTVTISDGVLRFQSDGLPNHERDAEYALPNQGVQVPGEATATAGADPTVAQSYDYSIPLTPTKADEPTSTSLGLIGMMISGAGLFNPYEGDGSTVATASNFSVKNADGDDVWFLDDCAGHPTPMGQYHYHALPKCVTAQVDTATGPSHIIGIAFDGYPIYGDRDIDGKQLTEADLDECNGITSATPEFPDGVYHYVLLDTADSTSSIRCFSGEVDESISAMAAMPGMGPMPDMGADAAEASSPAGAASQFQVEVWADNWMAVSVDGTVIGEDSVPITTERSFNAETFEFSAAYPFTIAIEAKDYKETESGLEYIGTDRQQMGDGGLIAQVTDLSTGEVVATTDASWSMFVVNRAPLDSACESAADPDAVCEHETLEVPDAWSGTDFDDATWDRATVWTSADVSPKDGYDEITWDDGAQLIWGDDLDVVNTILVRTVVTG